jgi:hypothetical protein
MPLPTPNEKNSSSPTHFIGNLMGFVEGLKREAEKRKIPNPVENRTPVVRLTADNL